MALLPTSSASPFPSPPLDMAAGRNAFFLELLPNCKAVSKTSGTAHGAGVECNAEGGNRVMETEAPCWINA